MAARKPKTDPVEKPEYKPTLREAAAVKELRGRRAEQPPRLKVSKSENGFKIRPDHGCSARQQECTEAWPLYARSHCSTPAAWRADATIAQANPEDRLSNNSGSALTRPSYFCLRGFRTPRPPPFSSRNSIPAASSLWHYDAAAGHKLRLPMPRWPAILRYALRGCFRIRGGHGGCGWSGASPSPRGAFPQPDAAAPPWRT
jgi:hypothetical protein